jgi:hypothetical protein
MELRLMCVLLMRKVEKIRALFIHALEFEWQALNDKLGHVLGKDGAKASA